MIFRNLLSFEVVSRIMYNVHSDNLERIFFTTANRLNFPLIMVLVSLLYHFDKLVYSIFRAIRLKVVRYHICTYNIKICWDNH